MNTTPTARDQLFTVGHSDHTVDGLISLLARYGVTAVADVRSQPYSRFAPQHNRENLGAVLTAASIAYVFLGRELGARRTESEAYRGRQARYELIRELPAYQEGIARLRNGVKTERIALLCAEQDPLTCHRTILICRSLRSDSIDIAHILADGSLETSDDADRRLIKMMDLPPRDLFRDNEEFIALAYDMQSERIAYVESDGAVRRGERPS